MILDQCAAVCSKPAIVIQSTLTTSIVKYLFRFVTYCYGTLFAQNSFVVVVHNSTLKRVGCKLLYPSPQKRLFTLAALRKSKKRDKSSLDKCTIPMINTFRLDKKLHFSQFYCVF